MMLIHPLMMLSSAYNWCNYKTFREKVQPTIFAFVFPVFPNFRQENRFKVYPSEPCPYRGSCRILQFFVCAPIFVDYSTGDLKKKLYECIKFIQSLCKL